MFTHVTPGQKVDRDNPMMSADVWNKIQSATKDHLSKKGGSKKEATQQFDRFYFRNDAGEDLPEWSVIGLEEPVILPEDDIKEREFKYRFTFTGVKPQEKHLARYGIVQTPAKNDKIGQVIVDGLTVARVNVTNECHNFAERKIDDISALESSDAGSAVILWKEEGTGLKWALIRIDYSGLIRFKLTERWEVMDYPDGKAIQIDYEGTEIGEEFAIKSMPGLERIFGPADIGFKGWALPITTCTSGGETLEYHIVMMQRFAQYITGFADFGGTCEQIVADLDYWHGENPQGSSGGGWVVKAKVNTDIFPCGCLGKETFHAVFDETESADGELIYKVISLKPWLNVVEGAACSNACVPGETTRTLIFDGLGFEVINTDCNDVPCAKVIAWRGVGMIDSPCEAETGGEDPTVTNTHQLQIEKPLKVEFQGICPVVGKISLEEDFIKAKEPETGDCIEVKVEYEDCKYVISAVLDPECLPTLVAGDCIAITPGVDPETGKETNTIDNTMEISEGDGITIEDEGEDGCEKVINAIPYTGGICIEVNDFQINNTMTVVGGDGIRVDKDGCTYSVHLAGEVADPKTTLELLCDVEVEVSPIEIICVETSGSWSFVVTGGEVTVTKSFTTLTMPSSLVEVESDCGTSGGDPVDLCNECEITCAEGEELIVNTSTGECDCIHGDERVPNGWKACTNNVFSCADCDACPEGEAMIMKMSDGECDCTEITDPPTYFEGWMYCQDVDPPMPDGEGIAFNSIDCEAGQPHFSFTFLGMPEGATSVSIQVTGDMGSSAQVGPSSGPGEEIPGQEYWGALNQGWTAVQPGECFTFDVSYAGSSVTQQFSACCPGGDARIDWVFEDDFGNPSFDCASNPNNEGYVGVTINSLPDGWASFAWEVTGGGCNYNLGGDINIGQVFPASWALPTYGTPQEGCGENGFEPGNTYTVTLQIKDEAGNIIGTKSRNFTCEGGEQ